MQNVLNALVAQAGWAILLLRIVLAVIFFAHGWPKIKNFKGTAGWLGGEGFKPGWFWAALVCIAEVGGGIFLLLGLYTQVAALVLTVNILVALFFKVHKKAGFKVDMTHGGWEFDLLIIAALLLLTTVGSGYATLL
jgi:putative oxidoreductase